MKRHFAKKLLLCGLVWMGFDWVGLANQSLNDKISTNKSALESQKKKEQQINKKLQELGAKINTQLKEFQSLQKLIEESEKTIANNQEEFQKKQKSITSLTQKQQELFTKRKNIELEIIDVIAKDISFVLLLNDFLPESIQDLITEETFKVLNQSTKDHLISLSKEQSQTIQTIQSLQKEIKAIDRFLQAENKKKEALKLLQTQQQKLIASYQKEITKYNDELKQIIKERNELQDILVNLKILKSQEEEKKRKLQELAKEQNLAPNTPTPSPQAQKTQPIEDIDVRQIASSYHNISTTKYQGQKTIAPLDSYEIEKKFGPYFDPVYKMKVFNESITLLPKGDHKVKSVLDGKIVFAKDTPILKKVIIIEHKNNLHTIYAQLDKIAPTIKPGSAVKKGYTIGKASNNLKFEVTLKDKHIDPLELISLN